MEISRDELEELVERSEEWLERQRHRLLHESDWQRWGSRGGRETLRRYGNSWMALLALKRWGRITAAELEAAVDEDNRPGQHAASIGRRAVMATPSGIRDSGS